MINKSQIECYNHVCMCLYIYYEKQNQEQPTLLLVYK